MPMMLTSYWQRRASNGFVVRCCDGAEVDWRLMCSWMSRSSANVVPVDDPSVKQVKAESQHLSAESLDECFDVFTQQERVCRL